MPAQASIQKVVRVVRREGLSGIAARFRERWRKYFRFISCWLVSYDIDMKGPLPQAKKPVVIRELLPEDSAGVNALVRIYNVTADAPGILGRMRDSEHCYVAYLDNRPVSYAWFSRKEWVREYYNDLLHLRPGEIYIHDAYTIPELRGQNIYPLLKAQGARELAQRSGAKSVLSYVKVQNHASLNASRKLGGKKVGWFGYLRFFGKHIPLVVRFKPRKL